MQPVDSTWLMPCSPSAMEISLDTMPTIETGIAYGVTRLQAAGVVLAVLPLGDVDAARAAADHDARRRGSPMREAGVVPGFARGEHGDQRRPRVAARIRPRRGRPRSTARSRSSVVERDRRARPRPPGMADRDASNSVMAACRCSRG